MENKTKQYITVTVVGVCTYAALMNLSDVLRVMGKFVSLLLPVIIGGILALFINVPMNGMEKHLRRLVRKWKKQPSDRQLHILSLVLTLGCIFLIFFAALMLLVPELVRSCQGVYAQLETVIPRWNAYLHTHLKNTGLLEQQLSEINWEQTLRSALDGVNVLAANVAGALSSTVSVVSTAAFGFIIAIYMLLEKERLCTHTRKLICAYLKPPFGESLLRFAGAFSHSFANFLTGQCSEAVILGVLMFLAFTVFGLPYGSLAGILTAVCAIIPYLGAFISGAVSVFLVLLVSPPLAVRALAVYLVVQFVENQFIYPRVVGSSVGLPSLYILTAALIGGKLFGIIGILFFIPLAAAVTGLVKEDTDRRLRRIGEEA